MNHPYRLSAKTMTRATGTKTTRPNKMRRIHQYEEAPFLLERTTHPLQIYPPVTQGNSDPTTKGAVRSWSTSPAHCRRQTMATTLLETPILAVTRNHPHRPERRKNHPGFGKKTKVAEGTTATTENGTSESGPTTTTTRIGLPLTSATGEKKSAGKSTRRRKRRIHRHRRRHGTDHEREKRAKNGERKTGVFSMARKKGRNFIKQGGLNQHPILITLCLD
mmetsp:Transcript_20153/g.41807  ORF Transcript_20153/g.41807 Transcript_20153/m.41807 type:complete len:220 (-) Transcript_20153:19-678(-)